MTRRFARIGVLLASIAFIASGISPQARQGSPPSRTPTLPKPSGPFGVGRVAFDWIDSSRPADMAADRGPNAELMVYLWYPTRAPGRELKGALLPSAKAIDLAGAPDSFKTQAFGGNWPLVVSGEITSHAQDGAPILGKLKAFQVVLFSPGAYGTSFQYTSAIEDLVSHGYIVASIEHTSEVAAVTFSDGNVHIYSAARIPKEAIPPPGSTPEQYEDKLEAWYRHNVDVRAADISFVLDKLITLNRSPSAASQFAGRLDVGHVAVVGHSRGGWSAIIACRRDARLKACVNEDGNAGGHGFDFPGASIPTQPILYVEVEPVLATGTTPDTWIVLKQLHLTPDEWMQRWRENVEEEFRSFPAGGYFVQLTGPGFEHYSFADEAVLKAAKEGSSDKESVALKNLRLTEEITRAFLDEILRNKRQSTLHDGPTMLVQHFGPAN
jgi:pimeloyl-ACP methyl ester carboxylesterase